MSDFSDLPKYCPKCGAELPAEALDGLCPRCLMDEVMQPTIVSDASRQKHSAIFTPEELAPLFPQYEILRMLGRGGMGAVYLARQISLNRLVAIKILPADMAGTEHGFAERFKNEAQAMAQLSHPGIVAVYDFGQTSNGLLYIVMEYIEGTDVQLMLSSQGRLHSAHAMAITAHVCDALQYAHSCGIIHRDIKPSNIMVGNNGVVKVADFGLAKMSQGQTTGLTQSGMAMGTPHFMAPEVLTLGSAVDQRADIYAVGVMLYQMLTGKLPQGMFELPSFQVPGLDPRYDQIVARALRDDREQRYQAAVDLRHDLDAILTQPVEKTQPDAEEVTALPPVEQRGRKKARVPSLASPHAAPAAHRKKKPLAPILTVLGVSAVLAAAIVHFRDHAPGRTSTQPALATKEQPFVNSLGMQFVPVPITGGPTNGQRVIFSIWDTRVQDYEVFAQETHRLWPKPSFEQGPTHPAVSINWDDAKAFCAWITERERKAGRLGANEVYRLPSDHEWSCAAGIGEYEDANQTPPEKHGQMKDVYSWGARSFPPDHAGNFADAAYHKKFPNEKWLEGYSDGYPTTSPVESFPANDCGLHDMNGNVWQWCEDFMDATQNRHVMRGCSYSNLPFLLSNRKSDPASARYDHGDLGFRCVIAPSVSSSPAPQIAPPSSSAKDAPFSNSLGMKFVPVPGTDVLFCIHETRFKDFAVYAREVPGMHTSWTIQTCQNFTVTERAEDHPVTNVSWEDAVKFCSWLSNREGKTYRLPTDREWSTAVGIGGSEQWNPYSTPATVFKDQRHYPWGTEWPPPKNAGNYDDKSRRTVIPANGTPLAKDYDDGFPYTAPVMSFPPNQLGLYDLGGNVYEWCADWYDSTKKGRVLRGACWSYGTLQSSARIGLPPDTRRNCDGFRLVLLPAMTAVAPQPAVPSNDIVGSKTSADLAKATKAAPFTNSLGMKFVPVPITGGPPNGKRVLFSIWETRVQDYEVFAQETKREWKKPGFAQASDHPVVMIDWIDAQAFCAWLTERERKAGRLGLQERYRLPTDHEWSCAVGIGEREDTNRPPMTKSQQISDEFPWGKAWPPPAGAGNYAGEELLPAQALGKYAFIKNVLTGCHDGYVETSPVGSFPANRLGLHDLGGNAAEWCEDGSDEPQKVRISRGANWNCSGMGDLRSSRRWIGPVELGGDGIGFRCVLDSSAQAASHNLESHAAR